MSETWLGLAISGVAMLIAMPLVASHYRRERRRAQLLLKLDRNDLWYRARTGITAKRESKRTNR